MAQSNHIVDPGSKSFSLHFKVNTHKLQPNESTLTHIPGEQLVDAFKLGHIDLLNPHSIDLSVNTSPSNVLGVSLSHGENGEHPLQTHSRAILVDHEREVSEGYHTVSTNARVSHVHSLTLTPTNEQQASAVTVAKRLGPQWRGMGPKNTTAGAWKTEIDGKPVVLVSESSTDGTKSAVHKFLVHNQTNAKLFDGVYTHNKQQLTTAPDGSNAIIMTQAHFEQAQEQLAKSLKTTSPFQHGLTAKITNLGDTAIESTQPTYVNVAIHRTAFDPVDGLVTAADSSVRANEINTIAGRSNGNKVTVLPYKEAVQVTPYSETTVSSGITKAGADSH